MSGLTLQEAYVMGLCDGIRAYAWMKDGETYVGTAGKRLAAAIDDAMAGVYPPQQDMLRVAADESRGLA